MVSDVAAGVELGPAASENAGALVALVGAVPNPPNAEGVPNAGLGFSLSASPFTAGVAEGIPNEKGLWLSDWSPPNNDGALGSPKSGGAFVSAAGVLCEESLPTAPPLVPKLGTGGRAPGATKAGALEKKLGMGASVFFSPSHKGFAVSVVGFTAPAVGAPKMDVPM